MKYNVFLSYTAKDKPIAQAISQSLMNAFNGEIMVYLADEQVAGGDNWKNELKSNLEKCNSIISLISKDSILKPWIYVEWSAFWLQDKKYFTLLLDEVKLTDLIQPLLDRQVVYLNEKTSIISFFRALSGEIDTKEVNYWLYIENFLTNLNKGINIKLKNEFGVYANPNTLLPSTDHEKLLICEYYYSIEDISVVTRILKYVSDDIAKKDFILRILSTSKFQVDKEIKIAIEISKFIERPYFLGVIMRAILEKGISSHNILIELVELIARKSQTELKLLVLYMSKHDLSNSSICRYTIGKIEGSSTLRQIICRLIDNGATTSTELISYLLDRIKGNAEFRTLSIYLIENDLEESSLFKLSVEKNNNSNELKNVAIELIDNNKYSKSVFDFTLQEIIKSKKSSTKSILVDLFKRLRRVDPNFAKGFIDNHDSVPGYLL